jgi:hypothetical protein
MQYFDIPNLGNYRQNSRIKQMVTSAHFKIFLIMCGMNVFPQWLQVICKSVCKSYASNSMVTNQDA